MKTALIASLLALLLVPPAVADPPPPFDMSGERPKDAIPPPAAGSPAAPPKTAPPTSAPPLAVPQGAATTAPKPASPRGNVTAPRPPPVEYRRFLIPFSQLGLNGEIDRRTWSIYLTPEEAAAGAKLNIGYQNSIIVAPEVSTLSAQINNHIVGQSPIRSPDAQSELSFDIPPGLLQPGPNLVSFEVNQRHRTDCSIESTYDLWTDLDPARTYISLRGARPPRLLGADAVRAVGVDEKGATEFNIVAPALQQPGNTKSLLRLTQALAVLSGMPNQSFVFSRNGIPPPLPGRLTVVVGTASEIQPLLPAMPAAAQTAPVATFATDPATGAPLILLTGPSWPDITQLIESMASTTDRSLSIRPDVLVTQRWRAPDAPFIVSQTDIPLSQLGVATAQFSGRRFRTDFSVAVPSDFYATAYGEATILLDAAYSAAVLPGSHIDIYVNGNIASTVPISNEGGGIFRHLPIKVTLRHFKPGLNTIAIEAVLLTREDQVCAPGTSASTDPRFALFDTSVFRMPDFARVGQRPNLAATAGSGYPYGRAEAPLPLFMDRLDEDTLSATATFLGKLAVMASRPIPIEVVTSPAAVGDRDALFIGAIAQIPPMALSQLNIAAGAQESWQPLAQGQAQNVDTTATFEQWRSKVRGGAWSGQISAFEEWLKRNFDISLSSLRFRPEVEKPFTPSNTATLMIAQGASPDGAGTWTIVAAPTATDLRQSMAAMSTEDQWPQIAGHITTFSMDTKKIETVPVTRFEFVPTQAASFQNYRLILANWLSTNILSYAVLISIFAVLLGLATAAMLGNLGRRE
jgi:hypothetical protein